MEAESKLMKMRREKGDADEAAAQVLQWWVVSGERYAVSGEWRVEIDKR